MVRHARMRPRPAPKPALITALGGVVTAAALVVGTGSPFAMPGYLSWGAASSGVSGTGLAFRLTDEPTALGVTVLHEDGRVTRLKAGSAAARRALSGGPRAAGSSVRAIGLTRPVTALGTVRPALATPKPTPKPSPSPKPSPKPTPKPKPSPSPKPSPKPGSPGSGLPTASEQAQQYYLTQIAARRSWDAGRAGAGVTVAVLDSGIDRTHRDLAGQVVGQADCTGSRGCTSKMTAGTPYWHGTHVAGVVAAAADGKGVVGVAPRARLLDVRVLDANGNGDTAMVTAGVEWAIRQGAKILNMSIGSPGDDPALHAAIRRATARGVLVVGAAGNGFDPCSRSSSLTYPAAYAEVLSVAAATPDGLHAWFSSVSGYVDLAAPGVSVVSDSPGNHLSPADGTSVAAPQVAGAAADVWSGRPSWTASQVRSELLRTAIDLGAPGRDDVFGAGLVQAAAGGVASVATTQPKVTMALARSVQYPRPVTVTVQVTAPGGIPACGATVTLQTREAGTGVRRWRTASRVSARDDGTAVARVAVNRRTSVRAVVTGANWLPQVTSAEVEVRPSPLLRVTPRRVAGTVMLTVRTAPAAQLGLSLQRLDTARQVWVTVARGRSDSRGSASFRLPAGGRTVTLRVVSTSSADWAAAACEPVPARLSR